MLHTVLASLQDVDNGAGRSNSGSHAGSSYMPSQQDSITDFILLAACGASELLPQSPHVPADVFTACLTTPIKVLYVPHTQRQRKDENVHLFLLCVNRIVGYTHQKCTMQVCSATLQQPPMTVM